MKISFNWLREFVDLPADPREVGERLTEVGLALDALDRDGEDTILELDITANRGDCLSHLGVAREAAAIFGKTVRLPDVRVEDAPSGGPSIPVTIEDPSLCGRYTARAIEGVAVGPSPEWIARRLRSCGVRPVNNVADITNYVLLELGHPLHAFDLDRLDSTGIVVRRARSGETLETLDGVERRLSPEMLMIADGAGPIALAGIMGGLQSEISGATKNVLIESAWFDALSVRQTARALNLSTEASYRFERGTDREMARRASDRVTQLILELAGGRVSGSLVDVFPGRTGPRSIGLRRERIAGHLGLAIPDPEVASILTRLGFGLEGSPSGWDVTVPSYRHDVSQEEDLLEELARHYGYGRFPSTLPVWSGEGRDLPWRAEEQALRRTLEGLGYSETCTLAFSDRETEKRFAPDDLPVAIRNPLSEDEPILRASLLPSLLRVVRWNLNRGIRDLKLYEISKVYPSRGEYRQLVVVMTGALWPRNMHRSEVESDFYALKGDIEGLVARFTPVPPNDGPLPEHYQPGRSMRLDSRVVLGELTESALGAFRIRQRVYAAEIAVEELYQARLGSVAVAPIPKYPRVRRDLSLLVDRRLRFSDIVSAVHAVGIAELASIAPFDRLESGPFPDSCYALAISIEYQSPERTLTDAEVAEFDRRVLSGLEAIGARLRN